MKRSLLFLPFLLLLVVTSTDRVHASTTLFYQYDANGNMISGDGKYFEYNDANWLVKVRHGAESGPVIAEYFCDYRASG